MNYWEALIPLVAGIWLLVLSQKRDPSAPPRTALTRKDPQSEGTPRQRKLERYGWTIIACTAVYCFVVSATTHAMAEAPWTTVEQPNQFAVEMPDNRSAEEDTIDLGFGQVHSQKWKANWGKSGHLQIRYVDFRRRKVPPQALALAMSAVADQLRAKQYTITNTQEQTLRNNHGAIIDAESFKDRARTMILVTNSRIYVLSQTARTVEEFDERFFDSFRLMNGPTIATARVDPGN